MIDFLPKKFERFSLHIILLVIGYMFVFIFFAPDTGDIVYQGVVRGYVLSNHQGGEGMLAALFVIIILITPIKLFLSKYKKNDEEKINK